MYNNNLTFEADEVIMYLRKSRSDDPLLTVEEVLAKHETILNEWVDKNISISIPQSNIFKEVVSGETLADRPEMLRILKLIESPKIKAILVVEVQRLSRGDLEDAGKLIKILRYTGTAVITPYRTYNLQDEYDRDFFERELKRGNEYLEYIKKIMGRGRIASVQSGNYLGAYTPYGYEKTFVMDGRRKCPTLKVLPEKANIVRMIFDLYVNQDMGLKSICNHLDNLGVKPERGEHWSAGTIKDILANETYIGKVRWGRRPELKTVEDYELKILRPRNTEYLSCDGRHEAIIDVELFQAAADKRGRTHKAKSDVKLRNPLAGLVYCQCGKAMVYHPHKLKDGTAATRYQCNGQKYCHTPSCKFNDVLELVKQSLEDSIIDFELKIEQSHNNTYDFHQKLIWDLQSRLRELEKKEVNQWEKYSEEGMPKVVFDKLNEKVKKDIADTKAALKNAVETMPTRIDYIEKTRRFKDAIDALNSDDIPVERKNAMLKACINHITYINAADTGLSIDVNMRL